MSRRFVVAVNTMTTEQDKAFARALDAAGLDWWHWVQNFWLVIDRSNRFTPEGLRNHLSIIMTGRHSIVIQVEPTGSWAGFGPAGDRLDMGRWIETSWFTKD